MNENTRNPSKSEFNLSNKIERLKMRINDYWTNGEGQCICPECWENRESDEERVKDCMFLIIFKEIDKFVEKELAGGKLT